MSVRRNSTQPNSSQLPVGLRWVELLDVHWASGRFPSERDRSLGSLVHDRCACGCENPGNDVIEASTASNPTRSSLKACISIAIRARYDSIRYVHSSSIRAFDDRCWNEGVSLNVIGSLTGVITCPEMTCSLFTSLQSSYYTCTLWKRSIIIVLLCGNNGSRWWRCFMVCSSCNSDTCQRMRFAMQKEKRKVWVKRTFQRRQSKGSYSSLLRELRDEDPHSFRAYLSMDIDSFDYLLHMLIPHKWVR